MEEAIRSGKEIERVLIRRGLSGELFKAFFADLCAANIPYQDVPEEKLNRVTRKNHQGVIAFISPIVYQNIEEIIPSLYDQGITPFILILDCITDVRNIGAIARSAECAGVHAIVVPDKGSAQLNADAIKTSAGALHHIPFCRVQSLANTVKFLKNSGLVIVAATEKAVDLYYKVSYTKPVAVVMGAEDTGIGPELLRISDHLVRIPVNGQIQSLNVSAAATVILYEAVKQRSI